MLLDLGKMRKATDILYGFFHGITGSGELPLVVKTVPLVWYMHSFSPVSLIRKSRKSQFPAQTRP